MSFQDLVTLVNESDLFIGEMDKIEAHRGKGKRHRAISVFLFKRPHVILSGMSEANEAEGSLELLIQQRSTEKIVGGNQWANTVCGNVRPTETYEECAYRRLREELGIEKVQLKPIYTFEYHLQCNAEFSEWEMDQVYIGWYSGEVTPNPSEAQDFLWVKWSELLEKEQQAILNRKEFHTKHIEIHDKNFTLAPWFVWMLGDKELITKIENYLIN